jgi:short-subunit dehydrogenase
MGDSTPKVAMITGASSGIGLETARSFARRGYNVVLAARRVDRLQAAADACRALGVEAMVAPTDVADRQQVFDAVNKAAERFGRLDVLVNNAGYGLFGEVVDLDEQDLRRLFDVNVFGLWYGMLAAVPIMTRQGGGHIFNVSSVIGKRGTPMHGGYCATKFAVAGLTESARVELRPHNIRCTLVCPAMTETEFFDKGSMARRAKLSFKKFHGSMPAGRVAEKIAATVGKSRPEIVFSLGGKLLALIATLSPRLADGMMELYRRDLAAAVQKGQQLK